MQKQSGAALFVALILLAILMVIGVYSVRNSSFQEKMAANVHQSNWAFAAAESGARAFNEMANNGNDLNPSHILFRTRVNGNVNFCVDENGAEAACGSTYLDGAAQKTTSTVDVNKEGCVQQLCFGYSLGTGTGTVKCLVYSVNSTGEIEGLQDQVEWWTYQVTAQC